MASPGTAERLLTALEDLVAREAACLHAGDLDGACATVARTAALVDELCWRIDELTAAPLRPRVRTLLARREENARRLAETRSAVARERDRFDEMRRRVRRVRPAYATRGSAGSRLEAVG